MPAAALKPTSTSARGPVPTQSTAKRSVQLDLPYEPLMKRPLPAGLPRDWYVTHNRRLKAMRLAIALLDSGVYLPDQARDATIRSTAATIGVHPPSATTCRMVRALMRYSR
ncbi:hypothetical protein AB0E75_20070 [Streptomyces griseoviridis]|uniref:Uncharacterized protein n=2 Tax=Streptomyces TaxID=1883 RepID=A0A918G617_STRGD|nr:MULTISPECIES: hypothetical protein [Streptomyces]GGS21328.1 hypothetical protein GCM10010238_07040 [Streptomyces niveoruber]GGU37605.1 hypothetical protein GCM10010259_30330 [Streptomyces daghestanicus]GHI34613.1 hypothetical protein Sdagh_63430 [Streptomyces daghestanicus]